MALPDEVEALAAAESAALAAEEVELDYMTEGFKSMSYWFNACQEHWREAWHAGNYLTMDETMIMWAGVASIVLTFLPRKPTPLGFMIKTCVDAKTGILLSMELVEGKEIDRLKPFYEEVGHTASVTLRVA